MRHGCGEPLLHRLDRALGVGFLVTPGRHAELRLEDVMAGQRGVLGMEPTFATLKDQGRDGFWVVPPNFSGHAPEELERRDHPFEHRLGSLKRQRQHEWGVGIGPGRDQKRHEPAAFGEVDVDVTEIRFEAFAGQMSQRDERLALTPTMGTDVTLDLGVNAAISLLVPKSAIDLRRGVTLLGRGVFVVGQDPFDGFMKRSKHRSGPVPRRRQWTG